MNTSALARALRSARMGLAFARVYAAYRLWLRRERPAHAASRVDAGDISIYYHQFGAGDPVLLLHGGFMFAETWAGQIPELSRRFRVIAPDSRGHGRTTLGSGPLTYCRMAADAAGLLDALGIASAHLVGWSDGGCASIALALERPELVRSMVLLGTPFHTDNYSGEARRAIEDILRPYSLSMLGLRAMRRLLTAEPRRGREFLERMSGMWRELPDFTPEELGRIEAPTLVIGCDRDEFLSLGPDPLQVFRDTAAAIPRARLEVVRGGTHSVHMERPRAVNRLVVGFLLPLAGGTHDPER